MKVFRRKLTLLKVVEAMKLYVTVACPRTHISESEFDDVFCKMLNNTTPFWDVLKEDDKVDIYQAFISMVVFS